MNGEEKNHVCKSSHLRIESLRKTCIFTISIGEPEHTLKRIILFFCDHLVKITSLQFTRSCTREASIKIDCEIDSDRMETTIRQLERVQGIRTLEKKEVKMMRSKI